MATSNEGRFSVIAEITRRMKQAKVAEYGDSPDESESDIMGFNACIRAGRQLFVVMHGPGPLSARQSVFWSALFLSCDEIFVAADARMKMVLPDPSDDEGLLLPRSPEQMEEEFYRNHGEEFGPGKLGEAWQRGEREGITECIIIQRYAMVGPPLLAHYSYVREGRKITWGKIASYPPDVTQHGAIDDSVKAAFLKRREIQPEIDEMLRVTHAEMGREGFPPDERQYWTDRGMAKHVSTRPGVLLVQYLGEIAAKGLPDVVFKDGEELDNESYKELGDD